jgi:hypothetical protein
MNLHRVGATAALIINLVLGSPGQAHAASPPPKANPPEPISPMEEAHNWHARTSDYYKRTWGVDIAGVKRVASGFMLEFRYAIVDAKKAEALQVKSSRPYIIDEATDVRLSVPAMENVGELRQSASPEAGRTFFIIFGNPGQVVKHGGHVTVVIGNFRVDGLVVQ